jgi:hypothetical protein
MKPLFVIDLDPDNPVSDEDIEAVLQPDPFEVVIRVTDPRDACMEALGARAGVFPSRGQARKNGFGGPVPHGFDMWGTSAGNFFVWNPRSPESKPTIGKKRNMTRMWFAFLDAMRPVPGPWRQPTTPDAIAAQKAGWAERRANGTWEEPFHLEDRK